MIYMYLWKGFFIVHHTHIIFDSIINDMNNLLVLIHSRGGFSASYN